MNFLEFRDRTSKHVNVPALKVNALTYVDLIGKPFHLRNVSTCM